MMAVRHNIALPNSCGIGATNCQAVSALFSGRNPAERPAIVRSYSANSLPYPNNTDWRQFIFAQNKHNYI